MRRHDIGGSLATLGFTLLLSCSSELSLDSVKLVTGPAEQSIVNGTRDPLTVALSEPQVRAIGWLYYAGQSSSAFCTATLIAPDLVVTAAHCVNGVSAGEIGFGVGVDPGAPEGTFLSVGVFANPQVDAALVRLGEDLTLSSLDITPIPVNQAVLASSMVGRAVQAGGYGETYDTSRDGRWFATVYVSELLGEEIVVDGRGDQGICYGDSGSALIDLDAAGDPVVLAVESWGDESCVDIDHMTRLDPIFAWIGPAIDGVDPPDPCAGVPSEGRCVDNVAEICRRDTLRQTDCNALGTECVYVAEAERYACACGELDAIGRCDGDTREYCRDGRISSYSCDRWGQACGWDAVAGRYDCVDFAACRPEDEAGRCDGEVAISCTAGRTTRQLCALDELECTATNPGVTCTEPVTETSPDGGLEASMNDGGLKVGGGGGVSCGVNAGAETAPLMSLALLGVAVALRMRRRQL